ncbi:DUF2959 domain-containing protein [Marinibactrum halimedae]|uniref:DUF2959 domain-containing protein n=1 Tax=Marinibactrum halimedae TaxID=1444977 RepID=A0AA37TBK4_9GAMM|nr:DUF2959 domain-containing protein [Marinibactrum halimedae]MCD9458242.1 DUF2959 domain-containing protein [Marinibactrum halimedae]GLS27130.1 DUF2959 domain-containing protein [Marinibactrum halimedae]
MRSTGFGDSSFWRSPFWGLPSSALRSVFLSIVFKGFVALSLIVGVSGCETAYYATLEQFGFHKRDILVDSIADARDSQTDAKEQFSSALERFRAELGTPEGDLSDKYDLLSDEYERSVDKADAVRDRIETVENVAEALFEEWESELSQYTSADLRRRSREKWVETRSKYEAMVSAMHRAEVRMEPVLNTFKDQVLFLKHNLNAQAVASLKTEFQSLDRSIQGLVGEMEKSIQEANQFIDLLESDGSSAQ